MSFVYPKVHFYSDFLLRSNFLNSGAGMLYKGNLKLAQASENILGSNGALCGTLTKDFLK